LARSSTASFPLAGAFRYRWSFRAGDERRKAAAAERIRVRRRERTNAGGSDRQDLSVGIRLKIIYLGSVMQLQEQGKLNLDSDVNNYLDLRIRRTFDKPITPRNLMTHTGGFEEEARNILLIKTKRP
jgi:hypothetical protein